MQKEKNYKGWSVKSSVKVSPRYRTLLAHSPRIIGAKCSSCRVRGQKSKFSYRLHIRNSFPRWH